MSGAPPPTRQNGASMLLSKHHGLGNDFLVLLDHADEHPISAETARAACDRHRGVGADGLIRVTRGDAAPFRMELRNEDGSLAEMSGNGISCMTQALAMAEAVTDVAEIETDAGLRTVTVSATSRTEHRMTVAMGEPRLGPELDEWLDDRFLRAVSVDVGNPHVVLQSADPSAPVDITAVGSRIDAATPDGANVEVIAPGADGEITMVVYERGVGPTQACGTGAVASALAAAHWGIAPSTVTVTQPGGAARVELPPSGPARLTVPVVAIASVKWPI